MPTMMENRPKRMKKLVTRLPTCSAVSSRLRLMSMTTNSARETTSVLTSRVSSSSPVAATASRNSERTSSSEKREISSSLNSGLASSVCRRIRSSREDSVKRGFCSLSLSRPITSGRDRASFRREAIWGSVKSTRSVLVTSSLSSAPLYSSPLLETTMELMKPSRPNNCWASVRCSSRVGSAPTGPLPDTTPRTVMETGSP